jgi:succinate dehydrogenase / fumarate reductase flavoprotein subunit
MAHNKEKSVVRGMDRRSFFKLGGMTAGAVAFAGMVGCSPQQTANTGGTNETVESSVPYAVYDADILVIGGGYGASFVMHEACKQGQNVLVVDKGPYGFSGGFGMNFDIMHTWEPHAYYENAEDVPGTNYKYIRNDELYKLTGVKNEVEVTPDVKPYVASSIL